jgi:hypothetical protein
MLSLQAVNFNVFEGLKVHGAPEFVVAGGRVVVYEYEVRDIFYETPSRPKSFRRNIYLSLTN